MSKELEALERGIIEFEKNLEDDPNNEWLKRTIAGMKKCYKRLEAIDNAKPSEALNSLEYLIGALKFASKNSILYTKHIDSYSTIKQALLKAQEQEKVLEILTSKKYIPLDTINPKFWDNEEEYDETVDYEFYLWLCEEECEYVVKEEQRLTQEEFDTLKRWADEEKD